MSKTPAVIVPLYKTKLNHLEDLSLKQCFKHLSQHKIIAVKPECLSLENYDYKFNEVISFDDEFFSNIAGYNRLMLSPVFYEKFLSYNYILIYQTDAFVFRDELLYWCKQGYDYIGAPWLRYDKYTDIIKAIKNTTLIYLHIKKNSKQPGSYLPTNRQFENRVGNGGFSLRNPKKFHQICIEEKELIDFYNTKSEHYFNEDTFWGIEVNRKRKRLNIPGYKKAIYFSLENSLPHAVKIMGDKLPFGCHAWDMHIDFWRPIFAEIDVII